MVLRINGKFTMGKFKSSLVLLEYLHWWCNIINNNNYFNEQSNISYSLFIHSISSLEEKDWIQTFYNNSLFQFITILSNSRQNISYSCNINPHLVNLWFFFWILPRNMTVLWSVNITNGWNVHHNCFNKASHFFSIVDYFYWSLSKF